MTHLLPPVTYYKANLHTHSTVSDGKLTPEQLRSAYKEKGYSILAITDHSVMVEHQHLSQPDFLMITGVEIDVMESFVPGQICPHNIFTGGYGLDMTRCKVGGLDVDEKEFHRFGLKEI